MSDLLRIMLKYYYYYVCGLLLKLRDFSFAIKKRIINC